MLMPTNQYTAHYLVATFQGKQKVDEVEVSEKEMDRLLLLLDSLDQTIRGDTVGTATDMNVGTKL